jgi:hypothetical protein
MPVQPSFVGLVVGKQGNPFGFSVGFNGRASEHADVNVCSSVNVP